MYFISDLVEVGGGLSLPNTIEVLNVDELVVKAEACIGHHVLWPLGDVGQVAQRLVPDVAVGRGWEK